MNQEFIIYSIYELESRLHDAIHYQHQAPNQLELMNNAIHDFLQQNQMRLIKDLTIQKPNYTKILDPNDD